jgi:hypothetical protein
MTRYNITTDNEHTIETVLRTIDSNLSNDLHCESKKYPYICSVLNICWDLWGELEWHPSKGYETTELEKFAWPFESLICAALEFAACTYKVPHEDQFVQQLKELHHCARVIFAVVRERKRKESRREEKDKK